MIENGVVLPMLYLPPVSWFVQLNRYKPHIMIEREEHFIKQTYRNRANIYSPDGALALIVPVIKGSKNHTRVKDVKISYDFNWQRLHWMSLQACYRRSAYFEYYEDDFTIFYEAKKPVFLFDYNQQLLQLLLKLLRIDTPLHYTKTYEPEYNGSVDLRAWYDPKKERLLEQKPYFQLFEDRHGFIKNLSIVDLLFNRGPQALDYLDDF